MKVLASMSKIRLERKKQTLIRTNQNIDFLKINNHRNTMDLFYINPISKLISTIMLLTQITKNIATLINDTYLSEELAKY